MATDSFQWKHGQPPPQIASHSNAKLDLLSSYLEQYFSTVAVYPAMDKISISFVDGFSGGGQYLLGSESRPGSPFVLLDAVKSASLRLNAGRQKPLIIDAYFYFIDANQDTLTYLRKELEYRGHGPELRDGRIHLIKGEFENSYKKIIDLIRDRHRAGRSVFVLDQKGWNAVQFSTIRDILHNLDRSEVILTFAVDWLMTYLNQGREFSKAMTRLGIDGARLRQYVDAKGPPGYQYVIQRLLLEDIKATTGAPFFTPFFIRSQSANRDLWIVHLSKIVTARNVMVSSHWEVGNSSLHRGKAGFEMLGFDPHWEDAQLLILGSIPALRSRCPRRCSLACQVKWKRCSAPAFQRYLSS